MLCCSVGVTVARVTVARVLPFYAVGPYTRMIFAHNMLPCRFVDMTGSLGAFLRCTATYYMP